MAPMAAPAAAMATSHASSAMLIAWSVVRLRTQHSPPHDRHTVLGSREPGKETVTCATAAHLTMNRDATPRHLTRNADPWRRRAHRRGAIDSPHGPMGVALAVAPAPAQRCAVDGQVLKYFACGWCTMIALVDCSGSICQFSVSVHPMRSGWISLKSFAWSAMSGHAG